MTRGHCDTAPKPRRFEGVGLCIAVTIAAAFGCDSTRGGYSTDETFFSDAGVGTSDCADDVVRCSRDLHSVVAACDESRIIATCRPDEGCNNGQCVPACSAADGTSVGCDFVTVAPSRFADNAGSCFGVLVTNTWATSARIEAEYAGRQLDISTSGRLVRSSGNELTSEPFTGEIQPGEVAILFLGHSPTRPVGPGDTGVNWINWVPCPPEVTPAVLHDTSIFGTARGQAFRIKTSAPVSAYSLYQLHTRGFAATATLLLPVPAWKSDYIVTNAWEANPSSPSTQIIAAEDDTEVTVESTVPIPPGPDVEGAVKGSLQTYRLNRDEVLQFAQAQELTGTRIAANKNIAVFGGHDCLKFPTGYGSCDQSQLQLFPIRSWGNTYVTVPHMSRRPLQAPEFVYYRIVAAEDGTMLSYEPSRPADAPVKLDRAGVALIRTTEPFIVGSQDREHPIAVYSYMTGASFINSENDEGDPEFTYVIPTEQYRDRYLFYADPAYRTSYLVVVRVRPEGRDFQPVVLDCAGSLGGWASIGTSGKYEYVRVPLSTTTGACRPGRHEMTSDGAFNVIVWGTDKYSSYSYPGGAAIRTLNTRRAIIR